MVDSILELFKSYIGTKDNSINQYALKYGIIISDNVDKTIIDKAISLYGIDSYLINQTFHKSFSTVENSSDLELFLEQLVHYITTYAFEALGIYDKNKVYIPKEELEIKELENDLVFTIINPITEQELKNRLNALIESNIALSTSTIKNILNLKDYLDINENNINKVTNRELKTTLYKELNIIPNNNIEFIRYINYFITENSLLIKDKSTINKYKEIDKRFIYYYFDKYIEKNNIESLSEIFNRYKVLFLALKTNKEELTLEEKRLNKIINRISKLSKKYHKPFILNDLDNFINFYNSNDKDIVISKLNETNIYRIIKLRNYINYKSLNNIHNVYKIRNNRVWIEDKVSNTNTNYEEIKNILDEFIINKLKTNLENKKVYIEDNINIALPTSEKQFIGNIPYGSSIDLGDKNIVVGIHWNNLEDKRIDLDLKVMSTKYAIGWDLNYKSDNKLLFTGDVTDAPLPNGATEAIYIDKEVNDAMFSVKVNNFTCEAGDAYYDFLLATANKEDLKNNYIIDPNNIIVKIPNNIIEYGKAEQTVGTVIAAKEGLKIVFTTLTTSNNRSASKSTLEYILRNYIYNESNTKCYLKDYLEKANITLSTKDECDIDLSINNLTKDTIINLFK